VLRCICCRSGRSCAARSNHLRQTNAQRILVIRGTAFFKDLFCPQIDSWNTIDGTFTVAQ
jgi:hypothetical protein